MSADDSQTFSRTCPSCGRRVPRKVTACRCGVELPPDTSDTFAVTEPASSSPTPAVAGVVVLVATLGFGAYWFTRPAAGPAATPGLSGATEAVGDIAAAAAADAAAPPPDANSAARREWEMAANLKTADRAPGKPSDLPAAPAADPSSIEEVITRTMPAIVRVETTQGSGSGFFVRPDTVITNRHVVMDNTEVTLRRGDGSSISARVDQTGADVDIAILKVAPAVNQTVIPIGSPAGLRLGQDVILIGSPFGVLQNSVSRGIVSAMRESEGVSLVQTDAAANPGNSGGPMLDRSGSAVGILTMGFKNSQGVNFAVSIDHARSMLEGRGTMVKAAPAYSQPGSPARPSFTPPTAPGSDAERVRENAQRGYERMVEGLAREADKFDTQWQRFKGQCYGGTIAGRFDREWFALFEPRAMPAEVPQECQQYFGQLKGEANRFKSAMKQGEEAARRAGVYPGVMRDARRSQRLEYDGWER